MKKTVLAAAALSLAAGGAFAQSTLQIYGLVDLSVESVKAQGASSVTRISSDNLATSRLGFKGMEDLGGGLKANFVLETAVKADTGAQGNSARFFDRAAWIGLSGGFGNLRLGRMDSLLGAMSGNSSILGNQAYDDFKIADMLGAKNWRRIDNAVTYALPEMLPGLKLEAQYSLAAGKNLSAETADVDTDKQYGMSVSYTVGPLALGVSHLNVKKNADGSDEEGGTLGYASYDFGTFKLIGYHQSDEDTDQGTEKRQLTGVRVNVPVTSEMLVTASYAQVNNATYTDNKDSKILALKGIYSLSKRTAVYGLYTNVSNSDTANLGIVDGVAPAAGNDASGLAVGVRHSF